MWSRFLDSFSRILPIWRRNPVATSRSHALRKRKFSSARIEARQPCGTNTIQNVIKQAKILDHLMLFVNYFTFKNASHHMYFAYSPFKFIPWWVKVRTVWWCYSIWSCTIYKEMEMFHDHPHNPYMISAWQKTFLWEILQDMLQWPEWDRGKTSKASQTLEFYSYQPSQPMKVIITSIQIPALGVIIQNPLVLGLSYVW